MTHDDDTYRDWDAAYVLGALTPEDRRKYEAFLAENPDRARDVTDIAGIPGLLRGLPSDAALALIYDTSATAAATSATVQPALLIQAAKKRQRRLRTRAAAAFLLVAASALFLGIAISQPSLRTPSAATSPTEASAALAMTPAQPRTLTAAVSTTSKPWGTRLDLTCAYSPAWSSAGKTFQLVIHTAISSQVVATWASSGTGAKDVAAATNVPVGQIRSVTIHDANTGQVLADLYP